MDLKTRVFGAKHRILTVIGAAAAVLGEVGGFAGLFPQDSRLHAICAGCALLGAGLSWPGAGKAPAPVPILLKDEKPPSKDVPPPGPISFLALLLAGSLLFLAAPARADETVPPLGGLFQIGRVHFSYGPRLLPGMLALNFHTGAVDAVQIGGLAYGVDAWNDKPYAVGLAGFLGAQTGSPPVIGTGIVISFFHYAAFGYRHGIIGGLKVEQFVAGPNVAF